MRYGPLEAYEIVGAGRGTQRYAVERTALFQIRLEGESPLEVVSVDVVDDRPSTPALDAALMPGGDVGRGEPDVGGVDAGENLMLADAQPVDGSAQSVPTQPVALRYTGTCAVQKRSLGSWMYVCLVLCLSRRFRKTF